MPETDPYARTKGQHREPPSGLRATLRHLGPGMILAGSVVGSGELIITTKLGAVAGFALLWFVVVSCLVKVVVQTEIARHTITSGKTFLTVFNSLPGPSRARPRWLTIPWMAVFVLACVVAVAAFVQFDSAERPGFVAPALAGGLIAVAIAAARALRGRERLRHQDAAVRAERPAMNWFTWMWMGMMLLMFVNSGAILGGTGQVIELVFPGLLGEGGARYWSILLAVTCGAILLAGTYASLERLLFVLVSTFTLVTVVCTALLHWTDYAVRWDDLAGGMSLGLPDLISTNVVLTALAMYSGTGVSFSEMWNYTYWCVEKGYASYVGDPESGGAWLRRARGWIRVMHTDAAVTLVLYTVSTICFYLLGAAILHSLGLDPDGRETLAVLGSIYTEGLGGWAAELFLVGSFFVLVSTVLSGAAGNSRMLADFLGVVGLINARDYGVRRRYVRIFIVVSLVLYSVAYWLFENPPQMLLITSSLIAAGMYPALGLGALYLRHRRTDPRVAPGGPTTLWLWVCGVVLAIVSPAGVFLALAISAGWVRFG